ncbi:conserved hypothetical protein [Thermosulfidibacter takaii ABI70S6]|uniref:Clostripain n=1 Tax=Thermosulfidibacter takaii (strain DSM 17441 / JCM 13301 / NBRC 103674 / ABI70S6) TaxID=1298851 RepID=A0A0S3QV46_THET7|nr:clostripain-related cysteine peptidase [Thermosulfidibacter takaii]BAT72179.1 conserved hypothetical protein [Thermosulfidibacter takaii ABI70S6]
MKKLLHLLAVLLSGSLLLTSCGGGGGGGGGTKSPEQTEWLVLIYMDGDNSLSSATDDDIGEIQRVHFPSSVKAVVLVDTNGNLGGEILETVQGSLSKTSDIDEPNMGDPNTLINFVETYYNKYKPRKLALIMWDHGYGWRGLEESLPLTREAAIDENDNDYLFMFEMVEALNALKQKNISFDLIGFDECLMGTMEVLYDLKDFAEVIVASENEEPFDGWNYTLLFNKLSNNPNMDPITLAYAIVDSYREAYENNCIDYVDYGCTLAAFTKNQIDDLVKNVNEIANLYDSTIFDAFNNTRTDALENPNYPEFVDLTNFAERLNNNLASSCQACVEIKNTMNTVYKVLIDTQFQGLAIYFPKNTDPDTDCYFSTFSSNTTCIFDYNITVHNYYNPFTETQWDDFLKNYYRDLNNY